MGYTKRSPWAWVPTLYFAEGIPYVVVMTVSVIMYKRLGVSNTDIALYTSWLYLPWVIKPFWSPFIDLIKTKRWWIVSMQLFIGAGLAGIALTIPAPTFLQYTLAFFWLMAFSSATHDIAADGFYMLGLDERNQAFFVGIRSTFYRLAMITGQGLLIILAGTIESNTGLPPVHFTVSTQSENIAPDIKNNPPAEPAIQQFVLSQSAITLQKIPSDSAQKILSAAKESNLQNGFVLPVEKITEEKSSWWTENISAPLKTKLNHAFGANKTEPSKKNQQINLVEIKLKLSKAPPPDQKIILNIGRKSGDKSLRIIHGERLIFNHQNGNKYARIIVQADPNLQGTTSASFQGLSGNIPLAWSITFYVLTGMFMVFFVYHRFILPRPKADKATSENQQIISGFISTFVSFFNKKNLGPALAFLLLFRLGESQLVKLASPFLLEDRQHDGLGLTTGEVGFIYGTIGIIFLTIGGILGGYLASKKGLRKWVWWMTLAINLPNLVYVYLSLATPDSFMLIASCVAIEQFGYGFGFTAYMLFMIYFSAGNSKTAHFAICTGLMALGMMIPGMISGWLQEIIGYQNFFIWVMLCTIPGFVILRWLDIDPSFGIKKEA